MTKYDSGEMDRMYNNRANVPGHPAILARWAADSADAMRSQPREVDIRYGAGPNEHLDVFPAHEHDAPVLVFIHGGWWRSMDKRDHAFLAPAFTSEGACVVLPNYALAPAVTIPQIVMQLVRSMEWTWRNIARFGGDPSRITVAGHSAGGHLAAMMLACDWPVAGKGLPPDLVKNVLSVSGVFDLESIRCTPFLQPSVQLTPEQVAKASPALLPAPARGSVYAVAGGDETAEFHHQNELLRSAWGKARVPVCEAVPGFNHFSILDALVQPGNRLNNLALQLLKDTA